VSTHGKWRIPLARAMVLLLQEGARMKASPIRTFRTLFIPVALVALVALPLVACGDDDDAPAADAAPSVDAEHEHDAGADAHAPPADCNSPFGLHIAADAEEKARAALALLDPTATAKLGWNEKRGTFQQIDKLEIPVTCTGTTNAYDVLFATLDASPDLFQIDRDDWNPDFAVPCNGLEVGEPTTLVIRRVKYGPLELRNDVFGAVIDKHEDGTMVLRNFYGTYIPAANAETLEQLQYCPELAADEIDAKLREPIFHFATFAPQQVCVLSHPGEYTVQENDSLVLEPGFTTMWDDESGDTTTIYRVRAATIRIAPANYNDDLINSNANCPDRDGTYDIGFIRSYDPMTGRKLGDKAAPKPGCIVC
jgi:hypothetical protein